VRDAPLVRLPHATDARRCAGGILDQLPLDDALLSRRGVDKRTERRHATQLIGKTDALIVFNSTHTRLRRVARPRLYRVRPSTKTNVMAESDASDRTYASSSA